jgi:hypothetical protein
MNAERRRRLLRLARRRGDKAAIAILEADRDYRPEPDYPVFVAPLRRAA